MERMVRRQSQSVAERARFQLAEIQNWAKQTGIISDLKLSLDVVSESMVEARMQKLLNQSGGGILSLPETSPFAALADRTRTTVIRAYSSFNRKLGFLAQFEIAAGILDPILESLGQNGKYTLHDEGIQRWSVSAEFAAFIEKALVFATAA